MRISDWSSYVCSSDLSLTPFARWLPPSRRLIWIFDTRFYIARAPEDAPMPFLPDGRETTRIFWTRPQDMLESAGQGAAQIIFPTRRNLERLAVHADYAALEAHARSITVRTIQPRTEEAEGRRWLVIPDDQGYPLTREPLDRSEEHTSELQSLMRISYAVFCLKKTKIRLTHNTPVV